jgi:hypothetical protein
MTNLTIDRLTLNLPGLSELEANRLANLIGEKLAGSEISSLSTRASPQISVNIPASASANVNIDWLAQQIVMNILQQLNQTLN